jgi:hypothetical protein
MQTRRLDRLLIAGLLAATAYAAYLLCDVVVRLIQSNDPEHQTSLLMWLAGFSIFYICTVWGISWMLRKRRRQYPGPGLNRWGLFTTFYYGRELTVLESFFKMPRLIPTFALAFVGVSWMVPSLFIHTLLQDLAPIGTSIDARFMFFCIGIGLIVINGVLAFWGLFGLQWREYVSGEMSDPAPDALTTTP